MSVRSYVAELRCSVFTYLTV